MKHTPPFTREKSLVSRQPRAARIPTVLLCAALGATTLPAHAEGPAPAPASAEDLASQAYTAYTEGKFSDAIALYMKSYNSYGTSAALLNVATIYDRNLHEREAAAEYY
ncbi:MAG TPA: hypothetical protein VHM25_25295, partial [Polyangiaceae bacterium]|nr:hypothetical protein [Polyangiaceae bacterium]